MFSYLRYFSIISFVVVVLAAGLLGVYFRSIASNDLAAVAEKSSVSLAQGYINTTWKTHLPSIKQLSALDTSKWKRYKEFVKFSEDTFRHFEGVPVTQLNIYTPGGERVLSVNQDAEITYTSEAAIDTLPEASEVRQGFAQAKRGQSYSHIIEDSEFQTPSGKTVKGAVVRTFVPIMPDSYSSIIAGADVKVEGVIEVFYDITPQWEQLYLFQMIGTGGILVIFVTLLGALFFTSKKAESIITTQHEANVELAATAAKAEAESRQKSQFLANVSHELRTPLNAIIGFSEIIKNEVMGALGNDTYMNYIKDIHSSGVHLLSLINDILDFSKAEAGKLELHLTELDATKLIKNCMRLVSPRAEQANVSLVTEVPKEHFVITGDAKKLKQVLLNLLSNAVKFTSENGEVKITAWQNVMDDSIAIEVKDSGIGIAPKDISRAMSPFGQVDSALSRKYEGTGLGLPLTKKFVEIMGGTFRIESEVNVGTTITITIPLTPPRHVMKAAAKAHAEDANTPREKQISPQLMAQPQPMEADEPAPSTAPSSPDSATAAPRKSLLSGSVDKPPAAPAEEKISLIRAEEATPAASQPAMMPEPKEQSPMAASAPPPPPSMDNLQPVRSLTAGKSLAPPPAAPEPASQAPEAQQAPMQPASQMPMPEAPALETSAPEAPAQTETPPPPAPPAAAPEMPIQGETPPPQPEAAPQAPPSPPQETPAGASDAAPEAPAAGGGSQKFMTYADLKKLSQNQGGNKPSGGEG